MLRSVDWKSAPFAHLQALPTNGKAITTWTNQDEAFADVVAGLRHTLAAPSGYEIGATDRPSSTTNRAEANAPLSWPTEEAGKYRVENQQTVQGQVVGDHATVHQYFGPLNSAVSPAPPPAIAPAPAKQVWNVPYPRNALFTGREELLTQLASTLHSGQAAAIGQPQAISGLGGIGKTQLALEYAYQHQQEYQVVLWAQAETKETLTTSFLELARLLNLREKEAPESAQVIEAVREWLRTSTDWLLILDNADDLALARDFLPSKCGGHVLLTTRAQAMGRFARQLEVETLPLEQGAVFLLRRAGLLAVDAPLEQV